MMQHFWRRRAARLVLLWVATGIALLVARTVDAESDWPQWRFDANRSAATDAAGPQRPGLLWKRSLGYPDPAFDHQYRMCADVTYSPVAAEGLVFVPSNIDDRVTAFDLTSGEVRWQFFTEGPVRMAPVYCNGSVVFGSDDGWVYCLAARDGAERWRLRGVPESLPNAKMLIGGRLCSRWPVRSAPVASNGVVYFGAGIWPEEGVYVTAVDVATGRVLWQNDRMSFIKQGMSDHSRAYDLSLPPHGYLAMIDGRLAVPSGRSLAAWFNPASGQMEPYTCFYVKTNPPRGTWYLAGSNNYCVQGGNWFGTQADAAPPVPAELADAKSALYWSRQTPENERYVIENRPFLAADTYRLHDENLYIEPVLTETTMYASEFVDEAKYLVPRGHTRVSFPKFDRIVARDLTAGQWKTTPHVNLAFGRKRVELLRLEFPVLWELASPLRVLIKADDRLFAGGDGTIAAVAIPDKGQEPRVVWHAAVDGTPVHALVADGKLVVITERGNIYCFGDGGAEPAVAEAPTERSSPYASPPSGFACLVGSNGIERAVALARQQGYRVVQFEANETAASQCRAQLATAGVRAREVQVVAGQPDRMSLTPYWANLVVVESLETDVQAEAILDIALDVLRPFTGELLLPGGAAQTDRMQRMLDERFGYTLQQRGEALVVRRTDAPQGAANWSHEEGGPDNRFSNSEQLVKWPLGVLWYSGDIDRYFTPESHFQHQRQPYPLVVNGRMFLITANLLHAIDIYTGDYLWRVEMPVTPWAESRLFDSRIYGRPTERNYAAADDLVYVVAGEKILAYDTATGRLALTISIPPELAAEAHRATHEPEQARFQGHTGTLLSAPSWTEVRLSNDLLLAVLDNTLIAVDRHSGKLKWKRASTHQTTTYALGDETLFGLDCDVPRFGGGGRGEKAGLLFAMDPNTGEILWQRAPEYADVPQHEIDHQRAWLLPIIPEIAYNAKHDLIVMTVNRNSLHVFHAADGSLAWSKRNIAPGNLQQIYPPVVTDDYLVVSKYQGCFGFLLDVQTGREMGTDTGIPQPRTCARILGTNDLLAYRDAATELYDVSGNRMIEFNSVRSGCTTSFIPAGGVMTAPMLGHGCVCNYPMFASLGLYHCPGIEKHRPRAVTAAWTNQAQPLMAVDEDVPSADRIDLKTCQLINATAVATGAAAQVSTKNEKAGYAIWQTDRPIEKGVVTLSAKRAPGSKRHGNVFLIFGPSDQPDQWIECRLYYGGRRTMTIAGHGVKTIEKHVDLDRSLLFTMTVHFDCEKGTIVFRVGRSELSARLSASSEMVRYYGCGGANSDNLVSKISVCDDEEELH